MRFCHRGVAQCAPDNTLGAFQAAVDAGCEGIELDIRMSKEGELIVCHDHPLSRLTCGHPTAPSIRTQGKPKGLRLGANIRCLDDRGIQVLSNLGDYPKRWEEMCSNGSLGFKTNYAAAFTKWWYENH